LGVGILEREDVLLPQTTRKGDRKSEGLWQMLRKWLCDRIAGRITSTATKTGRLKAVLVVAATLGILSVTAYVFHSRSVLAPPQPLTPMQDDTETEASHPTADGGSSLLGDAPVIGNLLHGTDDARASAPPPIIFMVGRRESDGAPDLSTPAQAVHSALELLGRGSTEALSQCFCDAAPDANEGLYPRYLGPPIEVVEVAEEGDTARVCWNATVRAGFTLEGKKRSPGETVRRETRLVRVDGVWKLARLYERSP
jgi:hypothetical protein